jgi:hypothetical protein
VPAGVQGRDPRPGQQLDVVVRVEALLVDVEPGGRLVPAQVLLGQQRALIRALGLLTDQHHPAVKALAAQRLGRHGPSKTRADNDKCLF